MLQNSNVKPMLLNFPQEFETERLLIRLPKPGDGKAVNEAIKESINELKAWMPFAHKEPTEEETEINIRNSYIKFLKREDLRLLAFLKETGEFVCSSGLHRIDWEVPKFEIGYWVDTRHRGKGYTTEVVEGITKFAFKELKARRLEIRCDSKNLKSRAIPERLGYILEGILRNDELSLDGKELTDTCVFSRISLD